MCYTHKAALEARLGMKIPVRHPLMAWIVKWAGDVLVWNIKGLDGLTAYQRVRGKPFRTRLAAMGEMVRFKNRNHEPLVNSKWHDGVFLGIDKRTGQYILHSDDGIKFARTILRVADSEKWNTEVVQKVNATPQSLHEPREPEVIFREPVPRAEDPPAKQAVARQVYISKRDLELHGYTQGCPRCDHARDYGYGRTSRPHSLVCRSRLMTEIAKTAEGQNRIARATERLDQTNWEMTRDDATRDRSQGEMAGGAAGAASTTPADFEPPVVVPSASLPMPVSIDPPVAGLSSQQNITVHDHLSSVDEEAVDEGNLGHEVGMDIDFC